LSSLLSVLLEETFAVLGKGVADRLVSQLEQTSGAIADFVSARRVASGAGRACFMLCGLFFSSISITGSH
jgi:hypothetical protein